MDFKIVCSTLEGIVFRDNYQVVPIKGLKDLKENTRYLNFMGYYHGGNLYASRTCALG